MIKIATADKRTDMSIRFIKGVGEKRASVLVSLGIRTIKDALLFFPRRYEDRTVIKKVEDCVAGEKCTLLVRLVSDVGTRRYPGSKNLTWAVFKDETGNIRVNWFNAPYIRDKLQRYSDYAIYGKISPGKNGICMNNPSVTQVLPNEPFKPDILPVYPLVKDIRQFEMRKIIAASIDKYKGSLLETLPGCILKKRGLCEVNKAYLSIHQPAGIDEYDEARKRLVYEELFYLQMALLSIRHTSEKAAKDRTYISNDAVFRFIAGLPFKLTASQSTALDEILSDMDSGKIMNRLLQGDVGSGKTVIAVCCALKAALSSIQAAVMVPTSILAVQHFETFTRLLKSQDVKIGLLYSGIKGKEKKEVLEGIRTGDIDIVIGTHSLIQKDVEFKNLGFVVTDEQHRFGVDQRLKLVAKAAEPDKLVMTATPIPRTLAMIIYGDTDISVISELPPGRIRTETYSVDESKRERIYDFIQKNIDSGMQAYIVCPLIEDTEAVDARSVTEYTQMIRPRFKNVRIGSLHGRMKTDEKEKVLYDFNSGSIDILVSTTVIEIGINVPNANIILVENAERYGLAQLHQLRGRVGRGRYKSYCILLSDAGNELTRKRIKVLTDSNDGFNISEMDMQLRGPGDFFGTRQHGIPDMKIANLYEDIGVLGLVQDDIKDIRDGTMVIARDEKTVMNGIISEIMEEMINA